MMNINPCLLCLVAIFSFSAAFIAVANRNLDSIYGHSRTLLSAQDTASELPSFETKEEYEQYLKDASTLPKGFATGSAIGKFIPEEAPMKGYLPIKGTVIYLTSGPTNNWAAVFTQNKVYGMHVE